MAVSSLSVSLLVSLVLGSNDRAHCIRKGFDRRLGLIDPPWKVVRDSSGCCPPAGRVSIVAMIRFWDIDFDLILRRRSFRSFDLLLSPPPFSGLSDLGVLLMRGTVVHREGYWCGFQLVFVMGLRGPVEDMIALGRHCVTACLLNHLWARDRVQDSVLLCMYGPLALPLESSDCFSH